MSDDSELDYVRTFLGKVHTAMTFKGFNEKKTVNTINDTERGLVYPPELIFATDNYTRKRYKILLSTDTEAKLTTAINNILLGCKKINRRESITDYTRPSSFCYIEVVNGNGVYEKPIRKRYEQTIVIDILWSVS